MLVRRAPALQHRDEAQRGVRRRRRPADHSAAGTGRGSAVSRIRPAAHSCGAMVAVVAGHAAGPALPGWLTLHQHVAHAARRLFRLSAQGDRALLHDGAGVGRRRHAAERAAVLQPGAGVDRADADRLRPARHAHPLPPRRRAGHRRHRR
eukprot:scaffold49600_cov219-Isochrysis_galbana.AAC.1